VEVLGGLSTPLDTPPIAEADPASDNP